jgi:hypothetical protein
LPQKNQPQPVTGSAIADQQAAADRVQLIATQRNSGNADERGARQENNQANRGLPLLA